MKCTKGTNMVCYRYEHCEKARFCNNVPKGIRAKLTKARKLEIAKLYAKLKA